MCFSVFISQANVIWNLAKKKTEDSVLAIASTYRCICIWFVQIKLKAGLILFDSAEKESTCVAKEQKETGYRGEGTKTDLGGCRRAISTASS